MLEGLLQRVVMKMIETPDFLSRCIRPKKWCFSSGVSDAVGSSKMMMRAFWRTARAISTICRCAAPSDETVAIGSTPKFSDCRNCCAAMLMRRMRLKKLSRPRKMFCATVSAGTRLFSWYTMAMPAFSASFGAVNTVGLPSSTISPLVGETLPR